MKSMKKRVMKMRVKCRKSRHVPDLAVCMLKKRTSSNFRYHYSVYNDEEPYPQYSFKIKRMAIKRFKKIKKIWLESPKRNKRLKQRRASEIENWQRKKRKRNEDSE